MLDRRRLEVLVAVVVEAHLLAPGVEQSEVALEEAAVLDRAHVENPALAVLSVKAVEVAVGQLRQHAVQDLRTKLNRSRGARQVVGLGFGSRGQSVHIEETAVRAAVRGSQGRDVGPQRNVRRDAHAASHRFVDRGERLDPDDFRIVESHSDRFVERLPDESDLEGFPLRRSEGLEAENPGRIFNVVEGGGLKTDRKGRESQQCQRNSAPHEKSSEMGVPPSLIFTGRPTA